MNADHLPDDLPIRSLGPRMVCARCGHRGADVRPDWRLMQAARIALARNSKGGFRAVPLEGGIRWKLLSRSAHHRTAVILYRD